MSIASGAVRSMRVNLLQKTLHAFNSQLKTTGGVLQKSRLILPASQDSFETAAKNAPELVNKTAALKEATPKPVVLSTLSPEAEFSAKFHALFGPSLKQGVKS